MSSTTANPLNGARTRARPGRIPIRIDGIAVRFALILCDTLTAGSYYACCEHDRITLRFPGEEICISLARPKADELSIAFTGTRHFPRAGVPRRTFRRLTVPGPPGSPAQRAAILREIEEFRKA
jgi:hypothetical protein